MSQPGFLQPCERPLILGHRGASADYPENTVLAFKKALALGADGVELDVMRCATGELVVVHDDDLGRVIGQKPGTGPLIRSASFDELREHDLGSGERVPTLEVVLEELGKDALVNIELKSPDVKTLGDYARLLRNDGLAESVAALLERMNRPPETTLVSSFDPMQIRRFDKAARGGARVPLGFLFHRNEAHPLRQGWPAYALPVQAVHPDAGLIDPVAMRNWRRRGYFVHTWTVDDLREIATLCMMGVDAIITNKPAAVVAAVGRQKFPSPNRDALSVP